MHRKFSFCALEPAPYVQGRNVFVYRTHLLQGTLDAIFSLAELAEFLSLERSCNACHVWVCLAGSWERLQVGTKTGN